MTRWGRGTEPFGAADLPQARPGRRSVVLAVVAYAIEVVAAAAMLAMPSNLPLPWPTLLPLAFSVLFGVVGPILHAAGAIFAIKALRRPDEGRGVAIIGLVLNLLAIVAVALGIWIAIGVRVAPA